MEVWKYFLVHRPSGSPCIQIETAECEQKFIVDLDAKCEPRRQRVKLRFGFGKSRKKQTKTRVKAQPKPKTRQLKICSEPGEPERPPVKASQKRKTPDIVQGESSAQSSQESETESSESSVSTGFEEQLSGSEQEEDWNTMPISSQAEQEESSAKKLDQEHETMKAKALENVRSKGTFFSKEIGIVDAGMAVSARSKCLFCGGFIPKDAPRFSFYHSTVRPSNWAHSECVVPLAKKFECVQQARRRLGELRTTFSQASHSQSSGSAEVPKNQVLLRAVISALEELPA
eukprot:Skav227764  [mRNA]  locus=scaffold1653:306846:307706:- [translate_table: standard]